ncbi:MAG TPA: AMP-binding protein, partial [Erythrobacter sp.]|nr:AMP-binding protein [Erythrobacter sp.]
ISPQEIESAAVASGLVAEAVALGVQDERLGHAIHLVVRTAVGSDDPESGLRKALQKELPNFMQPHVIHWRDTLPLNPNGKLDRTAIAAEIGA